MDNNSFLFNIYLGILNDLNIGHLKFQKYSLFKLNQPKT